MDKKILSPVVILVVCFLVSCSTKNKSHEEVIFNVEDSLLNTTPTFENEFGLVFFLPKKLVRQDSTSELFTRLKLALPNVNDVFIDEKDSLTVILSTVSNSDSLVMSLSENKGAKFSKSGFNVHQFFIQNQTANNFKLIIKDEENESPSGLMVDYFIPVKVFQKRIKSIESSIGTIKKNHKLKT